jgi:hypothetical protein
MLLPVGRIAGPHSMVTSATTAAANPASPVQARACERIGRVTHDDGPRGVAGGDGPRYQAGDLVNGGQDVKDDDGHGWILLRHSIALARRPARWDAPAVRREDKNSYAHPDGKLWERIRRHLVQESAGRCFACGHWAADGIDHDPVPLSECATQGIDPMDQRNLKVIHSSYRPCVTCRDAALANGGQKAGACNSLKGNGSVQRFRQLNADRTGLEMPGGVKPAKGRPRRVSTEPDQGEREWL